MRMPRVIVSSLLAAASVSLASEAARIRAGQVDNPYRVKGSPIAERMLEAAKKRPTPPGQKKFLWEYSGETTDELINLQEEFRVDSIVLTFEQAFMYKQRNRLPLSTVELDVLAIEALEREVNNGGFHQFFLNSSRQYAAIITGALERVGCPITARIASDAIDYLQISGDVTEAKVSAALRARGDKGITDLSAMDTRFFKYEERISDSVFAYIRAHKDEVPLPPSQSPARKS